MPEKEIFKFGSFGCHYTQRDDDKHIDAQHNDAQQNDAQQNVA
jgi:hypothetical protein